MMETLWLGVTWANKNNRAHTQEVSVIVQEGREKCEKYEA